MALSKSLDGRKSTGEDQIPPKLVSLASNKLPSAWTIAINCSIRNSRFPDDAKKAAVYPLDKGEPNRKVERNFRLISVLNALSKIYEKVLKEQQTQNLDNTLSVFIAAYRRACSTQYEILVLRPFLNTGVTLATCSLWGKIPFKKDSLIKMERWTDMGDWRILTIWWDAIWTTSFTSN